MRPTRHVFTLALAGSLAAGLSLQAFAQETIKIGELNSYKSQPAFLDPYKRGCDMAVEEINAKGGVLGKKIEYRATRRRRQSGRSRARRRRIGHA